jgi:hypothetical protein
MASGYTGNVVPRKGLRVRVSCPPLRLPVTSRVVPPSVSGGVRMSIEPGRRIALRGSEQL